MSTPTPTPPVSAVAPLRGGGEVVLAGVVPVEVVLVLVLELVVLGPEVVLVVVLVESAHCAACAADFRLALRPDLYANG